MINPVLLFALAFILLALQVFEYISDYSQLTKLKRITKFIGFLVTLVVAISSFQNARSSIALNQASNANLQQIGRLADAAASNSGTKPLSKFVEKATIKELESLRIGSISIGCQPNAALRCHELTNMFNAAGVSTPDMRIANMFSGETDHAIIIDSTIDNKKDAVALQNILTKAGIGDVATELYDQSYRPSAQNTPLPRLRVTVWHY